MCNFYLPVTKNIKGNNSFFFLLFFIIATPSFITAQWESSNNVLSSNSLDSVRVFSLAISPSNPSIIYASGSGGIHKSSDGGLTWLFLREASVASTIIIDPTNSEIVFLEDRTPLLVSYLLKTTNGGKNWETKLFTCTSFGFIKFDPQNSSILFTNTEENGLMKSSDRGET